MRGLREVLPSVMGFLVKNTRFALGLAILENVEDMPAEIVALEPETIMEVEPTLLHRARNLMGRLPFDQIDVLVVGELGKNYSGAGMDPNVIGRLMVETMPDHPRPVVTRLAVLDASEETHGNLVGVGFADLTTERLVSKLDPEPFRINTLTSCCLERARIPITLANDVEVFSAALDTCWRIDPLEARIVVIANTLELTTLWVPISASRLIINRFRSTPMTSSIKKRCFPRASEGAEALGLTPSLRTRAEPPISIFPRIFLETTCGSSENPK